MVAETSKAARHTETENKQTKAVFQWLLIMLGTGLIAEEIADKLGIPINTVHARINDLKNGYFYGEKETGLWYYAIATERRKKNRNGRKCIVWDLTLSVPDTDLQRELSDVEKQLRGLFAERRRLKVQIQNQNNASLFNN